jgi:membrane glycosyltransferase
MNKEWLSNLGLSLLAVFAPIKTVLLTVAVLIAFDFITGIWAAKKRGDKITSAAMRRTVSKLLVYQLCVISGYLLEKNLLDSVVPVTKLIAGVIGIVETKSILENSQIITGMNIFKELIAKLGSSNDSKNPPT